jgi:hypothetical protein
MAAFRIRRRPSLEIAWEVMPYLLARHEPPGRHRVVNVCAQCPRVGFHRVWWLLGALASPDAQCWWLVTSPARERVSGVRVEVHHRPPRVYVESGPMATQTLLSGRAEAPPAWRWR